MSYECRVSDGGISHVFVPLRLGALCTCGRKVVKLQEGRVAIGDIEMAPATAGVDTIDRLAPRIALRRRLRSRGVTTVIGPDASDDYLFLSPALVRERPSQPLPHRMC